MSRLASGPLGSGVDSRRRVSPVDRPNDPGELSSRSAVPLLLAPSFLARRPRVRCPSTQSPYPGADWRTWQVGQSPPLFVSLAPTADWVGHRADGTCSQAFGLSVKRRDGPLQEPYPRLHSGPGGCLSLSYPDLISHDGTRLPAVAQPRPGSPKGEMPLRGIGCQLHLWGTAPHDTAHPMRVRCRWPRVAAGFSAQSWGVTAGRSVRFCR